MNLDHVFKKTKTALKKSESTTTVPDGLLCRCSRCKKPILVQEVRDAYYICPKCGGYFKVRAYERIRRVADEGTFQESDRDLVGENPLGFEGYEEKLAAERLKTRMKEAIVTGTGSIDGIPAALGVMDSRFMMASMGWAVGEKLTRLIEKATTENLPLILFTCSGGARMQEGIHSLMQMARWFGYRKGYELLQRIWMPKTVQEKFELLEKIDEKLKAVFEDYMLKGRSPRQFGPKITTTATIARFLLTSKNKSQNAVECDFDFSGDSYETTRFEDDDYLSHNIDITESFLQSLGDAVQSEAVSSAFVWYDIDFSILEKEFFGAEKYHIYECSSLYADIPVFLEWMKMMNQEGKYLQWNVAIAGDKKATSKWSVGNIQVGKIERSKKTKQRDYIDIGSLRSGTDALSDIQISKLSADELKLYKETAKKRSSIIQNRGGLGVEDKPLLLLYRIDKNLGKETAAGRRTKINSNTDIIGFSIIVAGEPSGGTHARSITVRLPE